MRQVWLWSSILLAASAVPVQAGELPSRSPTSVRDAIVTAEAKAPAAQAKVEPAVPALESPPENAPRATQIEPIVKPVKRVAPKTPALETPKSAKSANGSSEHKSSKGRTAARPVVPARPNCDPGFKPDGEGKACVKTAASEPSSKKKH